MPNLYTFPYNAEAVSEITGIPVSDILCEDGRIFLDTSWTDSTSLDVVSNAPEVGAPIRRLRSTNVKHTVVISFSISNYWYNKLWLSFIYKLHGGIDNFNFPNLTYNSEVWGMTDAGNIKLVTAWFELSNGRPFTVKRRDRNHYTISATVCYLDNVIPQEEPSDDRLVSLSVSGDWTNTQYTDTPVDITGLVLTATYSSGNTEDVTLSATYSPATWGSVAGQQTITFSYTDGGITKTVTKTADVQESAPVLNEFEQWVTFRNFSTVSYSDLGGAVGKEAFAKCSTLREVNLPSVTEVSTYGFGGCSALEVVSLPACTSVGSFGFTLCYALSSISLPVCTYIGEVAFQWAISLTTISLPSVKTIRASAFVDCTGLSEIYIGTSDCTLNSSLVFNGTLITASTGSIYVPSDYVATYKNSTNWTYFSNRIFGY